MRAERDRRAAILTAEGFKQSRSSPPRVRSRARSCGPRARHRPASSRRRARPAPSSQVFGAIHRGKPTQKLLAYQYLQVLPQLARGDSNKMWIIPSELTEALRGIGGALGGNRHAARQPTTRTRTTGSRPAPPTTTCSPRPSWRTPPRPSPRLAGQAAKASAESTEHAAPTAPAAAADRPAGRHGAAGPDPGPPAGPTCLRQPPCPSRRSVSRPGRMTCRGIAEDPRA